MNTLQVANFFVCGTAIYALRVYEETFNERLHRIEPFWKFWGVKGLLSVNFLQTSVLAVIGHLLTQTQLSEDSFRTFVRDASPESPQCHVLRVARSSEQPREVNYYALTAEALLLAALNLRAYRPLAIQAYADLEDLDPVEPEALGAGGAI